MMTSLCLSTFPTITTSQSLLFSNPSSNIRFKVSCNASSDNHLKTPDENPKIMHNNDDNNNNNVDRRNLLLGLGGLYGATNLTNIGSALAYPITAPDDISHCVKASTNIKHPEDAVRGLACCPPSSSALPKPYVLPSFGKLRVRRPAHRLTPDYIVKYQDAIKKMKALDDDDPHSWKQQGMIHCAYCNGAYSQEMNCRPDLKLQVHGSSLFYPFHRWYLYFYERILGKLIDDPTFALPYWNWDNPMGMMLPAMFEAPGTNNDPKNNPLFDPYRDAGHRPPVIVDLQYSGVDSGAISADQINDNLSTMYNQMVRARCTDAFFGTDPDPERESLYGYIESGAHTAVHIWTGNPRMANREDLGNFSSAGYDPVFYVHHANVDRMWHIWKGLGHRHNNDPTSDDWLNASYVFYDENKELVRVYNKDCVNMEKMGYEYERSSTPWLKSRPTPRRKASKVALRSVGVVKKADETEFPVKLDKRVKVLVKRPVTNRSEDDKKNAAEMLILEGIRFNSEHFFKFDVLVNDEEDGVMTTAASSEFAGSFAQVPHKHGDNMYLSGKATFDITEILEDIEAEEDENVLVTLVPRAGPGDATVAKIKIELVPTC